MFFLSEDLCQDIEDLINCFEEQEEMLHQITAENILIESASSGYIPNMELVHERLRHKDEKLEKLNTLTDTANMYMESISPFVPFLMEDFPDLLTVLQDGLTELKKLMDEVCGDEDLYCFRIKNKLEKFKAVLENEFQLNSEIKRNEKKIM